MRLYKIALLGDVKSNLDSIKRELIREIKLVEFRESDSISDVKKNWDIEDVDIIICQHHQSSTESFELLNHLKISACICPVIIITDVISDEDIAKLIKEYEVSDIILKNDVERLIQSIKKELQVLDTPSESISETNDLKILALVAKHTHNGVIVTDANEKTIWVNDAYCKISGYTFEETLGKQPGSLLQGAKTDSETKNRIRHNLENKVPFSEEILNYHKNGEEYWIKLDITPIFENELHTGFVAIQEDITERKEAELKLSKNEKLLRSVTENLSGAVIRYSLEDELPGTIEFISESCINIYELTQQQILDNNQLLWDLIDPADVEKMIPTIVESAKNLTFWTFQYKMTTPSGKEKWIRASGSPRSELENNRVIWDTIIVDISKEVSYEKALEDSNNRLINAQKAGKIGDWYFDTITQDITWSEEIFNLYDRDPSLGVPSYEEVIYKYTIDNNDVFHEAVQRAANDGEPYELNLQIKTDLGRIKDMVTIGIPLRNKSGELVAVFGTAQDVTSRMEAQRKRKISEERLDVAVRATNLAVWDLDLPSGFNTVNDRWFEIMGFNRGDINSDSETFLSRVHPDDLEKIVNEFQKINDGQDFFDIVIRIKHKDGAYVYVKDQGRVIERHSDGSPSRIIGTDIDVTQEVENKNALVDANNRLKNAQKAGKIGDWHFDLQSQKISWSEETFNIYDRDPAKGVPSYQELVFGYTIDKSEEFHEMIQRAATSGEPYEITIRIKTDVESIKDVVAIGLPLKNEKGEILALFGTAQDITRRMDAIRNIRESETRLKKAQEAGKIGDWHLDLTNNSIFWSQQMYHIYDVDPSDGIPSFEELMYTFNLDSQDIIEERLGEGIRTGQPYEVTHKIKSKSGIVKDLISIGIPEVNDNGKVLSVRGTTQDISQRMGALRQIKESELRLEAAIQGADLAVWDMDLTTGTNIVNDRWFEMIGYSRGEISSDLDTLIQLFHPDDVAIIQKGFNLINEGVNELDFVIRLQHKDGTYRYVRDQGRVIHRNDKGEATRIIGTHLDITKEKQLSEELTQSLNEKTILLQEIHHRVKNNLAVIIGLLHLQSFHSKNDEVSIFYDEMSNRIKSIADVHELLYSSDTLSKINLKTYIEKLFNNVLSVSNNISPPTPNISINDDFEMNINQAIPLGLLINELLTNSVKHAFKEIDEPTISFSVTKKASDINIVYSDNGIGLNIERQSSPNSLGFTLINTLLEQLDSVYSFTNNVGFGIEFTFTLFDHNSDLISKH